MSPVELKQLRLGLTSIFLIISVLLNSLGIYCLRRTKRKAKSTVVTQHLILLFLSISELVYSFLALGKWILNYFDFNLNSLAYKIFYAGVFSSFYVYCCLLIVLLANRFVLVAFPRRCLDLLSQRRACYAVVTSCVFSYALAIPFVSLDTKYWRDYISIAYVVIEVLVLISTVGTFSFIGYKVRKTTPPLEHNQEKNHEKIQREHAADNRSKPYAANMSRRQFKLLTVALLTIFSFLPLVAVPDITVMALLRFGSISSTAIDFIYSMLNLNFVLDPLVYMVTYPLVRRHLRKILKRMRSTVVWESESKSTELS